MSRTQGADEAVVWAHGDEHVAAEQGRDILARGDFEAKELASVAVDGFQLSIIPDEPPPRHANIIGWPTQEQKEVQRLLAAELAARTTLVVRPV